MKSKEMNVRGQFFVPQENIKLKIKFRKLTMNTKKNSKRVVKTRQGKKNGARVKTKHNSNIIRSILKLHNEILQTYRVTVNKGIEIGKLLTNIKKELQHGEWLPLVAKLPFSSKTATNYMNLFKFQSEIKSARVTNLHEAYELLSNIKNHHRTITRQAKKKFRKEFADKKSNYKNPRIGNYINKIISGENYTVMKEMLRHGMAGKYSGIITSPPYGASFYYHKDYDDNKAYDSYIKEILKPFKLYPKLLRKGGRIFYIIGSIVKKENRDDNTDYNYQLVDDLKAAVKKSIPSLRFFNHIIWEKTGMGRNPLNKKWGTFCSPKSPLTRHCNEHILIWSKDKFELENIENTEPDITEKEFKELAWSVWSVAPYVSPGNPHPCSFPSKLIQKLLRFYTYPNDLILDPYGGASIVAQACKKLKRRFTTIELNGNFCEYGAEQLKSA